LNCSTGSCVFYLPQFLWRLPVTSNLRTPLPVVFALVFVRLGFGLVHDAVGMLGR